MQNQSRPKRFSNRKIMFIACFKGLFSTMPVLDPLLFTVLSCSFSLIAQRKRTKRKGTLSKVFYEGFTQTFKNRHKKRIPYPLVSFSGAFSGYTDDKDGYICRNLWVSFERQTTFFKRLGRYLCKI